MWYIYANIIYIIIVNFTNFLFETYVRYNNFHVFVVLFNKSFEIFKLHLLINEEILIKDLILLKICPIRNFI